MNNNLTAALLLPIRLGPNIHHWDKAFYLVFHFLIFTWMEGDDDDSDSRVVLLNLRMFKVESDDLPQAYCPTQSTQRLKGLEGCSVDFQEERLLCGRF